MDKFKQFFLRINLLNEQEFDELAKYATFSIKLPTSNLNNVAKVTLEIQTNEVLPINLFETLHTNIKNLMNTLIVKFVGHKIVINEKQLVDYFKYFIKINHINNILITNLIQRESLAISDSGLLMITYNSKSELNELKSIENKLLSFFQSFNFYITEIDYQFNKDNQLLETNRRAREEQIESNILKSISSPNQIQLSKVKFHNAETFRKYKKDVTKLSDIVYTGENSYAVVSGEIFKINVETLKNRSVKYTFYITDYTGTFVLTAFVGERKSNSRWGIDINLPMFYLDSFHKGQWVKASVRLDQNKYTNNDVQGMVSAIVSIETPKQFQRVDEINPPRIELLTHTNMSMLDGLIDPEVLIKRSKSYNWSAIGITDRFNVHAYPTIMAAAKKEKQKVCYGVECNVINRHIAIVQNPKNQLLNSGEYVLFDIETTGLNNEFDEITEFGAIKVKDGMIVDEVDWFSSINRPLSYKIKEKTHITDEMLANQPNIQETLKKIVNFFGDATLIAHNAHNFDIRFINKKLQQNHMPLLKNTILDTIPLSYAINTHLSRHNLGAIARDLKIPYDEATAHRANIDAHILYEVWQAMVHKLEQLKISNINELNQQLQNRQLHYNQFGNYVEIYARNQQGIKDIYRLVSAAHTNNLHKKPRVYWDDINRYRNNLIIANHPTESDVWDLALNGTDEEMAIVISQYDYIFIAPINNLAHQINREELTSTMVEETINKVIEFANKNHKKVIAVSDAYFLDPQDAIAHAVYVHTKQLGGGNHRFLRYGEDNDVLPDLHLRTTKEMLDEMSFIKDEKLLNAIVVQNSHDFVVEITSDLKPIRNGSFRPKIDDVSTKLKNLIADNTRLMYGDNVPIIIKERISHELDMIIKNDYAIIYWICHLLVKKTVEDGYIVGSRGSVGSSLVAYLAGISEVNPLKPHYYCSNCKTIDFNVSDHADGFDLPEKCCPNCGKTMFGDGHNIPFETFLGFEKDPKVPDIDLNFSGDYQSRAHDFIRAMFGKEHTFRAGTISTVADKTAYGWTRSYFELTKPNEIIKNSTIEWIASKCINVKRTTGQHPGGIIIVPKEYDILDFAPYNFPADDQSVGWYTTHFDFEKIHDNLLKFDILGHDDPTSLKMLEEITHINPKSIPFHDDRVMTLYSSLDSMKINRDLLIGETVGSLGLPEFGTPFVRKMLSVAKPKSFADLVRISGLSHGTNVWDQNAHDLIAKQGLTLAEVISCRDDIMLYLMRKGVDYVEAFKIMETVRKGKKLSKEQEQSMIDKNIPEWYLNSCNKIKYLFPKAHATAYVMMSWRMGWFKIHYPLAFYATYFSVRPSVFDLITIIKGPEAVRNKLIDIKTRLNDYKTKKDVKAKEKDLVTIYEIVLEMYARGYTFKNIDLDRSDATKFTIDGSSIVPPFSCLDGLGEAAAKSIVEARQIKPFISKADLLERSKISKTILETFNTLGITSSLDVDNQMSLF